MSKNRELNDREKEVLDRLEGVLKLRDVSWQRTAEIAGKSKNLGNQWSGRRSFPTEASLYLICQELGIAMGWLLTGDEPSAETTVVTQTEKDALAAIRRLPPRLQSIALAQLKALEDGITKK